MVKSALTLCSSEGLLCVALSLIYPCHWAFLTLAWHWRQISLHRESSQCSRWARLGPLMSSTWALDIWWTGGNRVEEGCNVSAVAQRTIGLKFDSNDVIGWLKTWQNEVCLTVWVDVQLLTPSISHCEPFTSDSAPAQRAIVFSVAFTHLQSTFPADRFIPCACEGLCILYNNQWPQDTRATRGWLLKSANEGNCACSQQQVLLTHAHTHTYTYKYIYICTHT